MSFPKDGPKKSDPCGAQCELLIETTMRMKSGLSRAQAAQFVLDAQPSWYWQTPEGEYLSSVADSKEGKAS